MSLYKVFNHALYKHMQAHAVWWPIVDQAEVGAYGVIRGGVFQRFGNITDRFGLGFKTSPKTPEAPLEFASEGVTKTYFDVNGNATTLADLGGGASAKVKFEFSKANSVRVQVASVHSISMDNVDGVARKLLEIEEWDPRFKVVWRSYIAEGGTILAAEKRDTTIEFDGEVSALKAIDNGTIKSHVGFSSSSSSSLQIGGDTGSVALKMFGFAPQFWLFGENRLKLLGKKGADKLWESLDTLGPDLEDDI